MHARKRANAPERTDYGASFRTSSRLTHTHILITYIVGDLCIKCTEQKCFDMSRPDVLIMECILIKGRLKTFVGRKLEKKRLEG